MSENRCICCGEIIPEGMLACPNCLVVSKKQEMKQEKRLIDANALKDEILSWAVCINKPHLLSKDDTLCVIDTAPTVDAVEVVHGQWDDDPYDPRFICSECGEWFLIENASGNMNYCPNCGADMRGDWNA